MDNAPIVELPLSGLQQSKLNTENWPAVVETFQAGRHRDSVYALLDYIDPGLRQATGNAGQTEFLIPHGSTVARVNVSNETLRVSLPFLGLPEKGNVALLRQVSELNFSALTLAQIHLKDGALSFEYEAPLEVCEPWKTYAVFSEICLTADAHDDVFVEKFGARRLAPMQVEPCTSEQKKQARERLEAYIAEGLAYMDFFEGKRYVGSAWDMACITLKKIQLFMWPQGYLASLVDRHGSNLYSSAPMQDRVAQARRAFQELLAFPREKFDECLYTPRFFIPPRKKSDLPYVRQYFDDIRETADREIAGQDFMGATLGLLQGILALEKNGIVATDISKMNWDALIAASGKPWKEAARILFRNVDTIMQMKLEGEENP